MKKIQIVNRLVAAALAVMMAFSPAAPAQAATARATTLRLEQTSGTVTLKNINGTAKRIVSKMRLNSGDSLKTAAASYAYISLDDTKAVKLDSNSQVSIKQSGRKNEVLVKSGKLFFNVSAPLKKSESLNIRTSTMVTGVRGTIGIVEDTSETESKLYLIEGHVELTSYDSTGTASTVKVEPGTVATVTKTVSEDGQAQTAVATEEMKAEELPAFAAAVIAEDTSIQERIDKAGVVKVDEIIKDVDKKVAQKEETEKVEEKKQQEAAQKRAEEGGAKIVEAKKAVKEKPVKDVPAENKPESGTKKEDSKKDDAKKDDTKKEEQNQPESGSLGGGSYGGSSAQPQSYSITYDFSELKGYIEQNKTLENDSASHIFYFYDSKGNLLSRYLITGASSGSAVFVAPGDVSLPGGCGLPTTYTPGDGQQIYTPVDQSSNPCYVYWELNGGDHLYIDNQMRGNITLKARIALNKSGNIATRGAICVEDKENLVFLSGDYRVVGPWSNVKVTGSGVPQYVRYYPMDSDNVTPPALYFRMQNKDAKADKLQDKENDYHVIHDTADGFWELVIKDQKDYSHQVKYDANNHEMPYCVELPAGAGADNVNICFSKKEMNVIEIHNYAAGYVTPSAVTKDSIEVREWYVRNDGSAEYRVAYDATGASLRLKLTAVSAAGINCAITGGAITDGAITDGEITDGEITGSAITANAGTGTAIVIKPGDGSDIYIRVKEQSKENYLELKHGETDREIYVVIPMPESSSESSPKKRKLEIVWSKVE